MTRKMLTKRENYLAAGVHIGLTMKTKDMSKFIYKIRPNGLAVLNIGALDERLHMLAKRMAKSNAVVVGRSKNAEKALLAFNRHTGVPVIAGRFMPGTFTNPNSRSFIEPDFVVLVDPAVDRQSLEEAVKSNIPVVAFCDTFNTTSHVDFVLPANNKSRKSIGLIFYILAREVLKERGEIKSSRDFKARMEEFTGEKDGKE